MNYDYATAMQDHLADVVRQLTRAAVLAQSKADAEDYDGIRRSIAGLIGTIDMELLWPIYRAYPALDPIGGAVPPVE